MIPRRILLENAVSPSSGDLNTILDGTGLKGMSLRGLEKCEEEKMGKQWGNIWEYHSLKPERKRQIEADASHANGSSPKSW